MIRAVRSALIAASFTLLASAGAAEPVGPDPALAPDEVIAIQLEALKNNDEPTPNAGIAQTFALAHPFNKRRTGPLARFERMIRSPAYRPLLGHSAHTIEPIGGDDRVMRFKVAVETPTGEVLEYQWEVARVAEGPDRGAWLTMAVSAPLDAGRAI